jgi:hypothetical protein
MADISDFVYNAMDDYKIELDEIAKVDLQNPVINLNGTHASVIPAFVESLQTEMGNEHLAIKGKCLFFRAINLEMNEDRFEERIDDMLRDYNEGRYGDMKASAYYIKSTTSLFAKLKAEKTPSFGILQEKKEYPLIIIN